MGDVGGKETKCLNPNIKKRVLPVRPHLYGLRLINNCTIQANSENCGPPLSNKFDLEVGQRSRSRSQHGTI